MYKTVSDKLLFFIPISFCKKKKKNCIGGKFHLEIFEELMFLTQ